MTEDEYILVSDLTRVRSAEAILRDIVPENNDHISAGEMQAVHRILQCCRMSMEDAIGDLNDG